MVKAVCGNVELVREDLKKRAEFGLNKYGITIEKANYNRRTLLQHAYEEAMDLAVYLKSEITRMDSEDV